MPRRASYSLATIRALPAQTVYASADATLRHMLAAEAHVREIDPACEYALSDTIERIVGARIGLGAGEVVVGRELRANLATLVLDLSERLSLDGSERDGGAATPDEIAAEIGVATKTLQRWRAAGLCAHWIREHGRPRVAIYRASLREFAELHPSEFARARSFRRFDAMERAELLAEGRRLLSEGWTLNLAAKELASRFHRSHEGVRLLFLRELGNVPRPRRSSAERAARFAETAWRFGIEPARIAERLGKSESLVRALVDRRRGEVLRGVQPAWVELSTFTLAGADETIPNAPAARKFQPLGLEDGDLVRAIHSAREIRRLFARDARAAADRDETRAAAMHFLLRRASRAIDALTRWPDRSRLDEIETDLRTALRLRALLVERGLVIALGRADQYCEGGPERLPSDELRALARALVASVLDTVSGFDPSRQKFDRAVSLAADYALAKAVRAPSPRLAHRAAAKHAAGVPVRLLGCVARWQHAVDPLAHHAEYIAMHARERACDLVARRYGFAGKAPRTVEQLAAEERTTVALLTKRLREAELAVRRAARA
ncbi:MAG: hypothetical protein LW636_07645 [Planctomycetaceae bacterium]|nr:hypothetical protein [Planctomycetaceae bacterium]